MKRFENFNTEDLQSLRNEIVLNSLFVSDYNNSFGISANSVCTFFDGYVEFISEIAEENGDTVGSPDYGNLTYNEFFDKYDTIDNLECWFNCFESFDWVAYDLDEFEQAA